MLSNLIIKTISEGLLLESCLDYEGLWTIPWKFREIYHETDPTVIREGTLRILKELLESGLIQPLSYNGSDYELWNLSTTDVLFRINAEWDALGDEPNIGDIVYFTATEKGEQAAQLIPREIE